MNQIRKLARGVAKRRMKAEGMVQLCKPIARNTKHDNSKFAVSWKNYVRYGK